MFVNSPNLMFDKEFLKRLDNYPHREVYAKLISLTFDEKPIVEITGNVTAGSISVDGSSAVRRTCNITMITDQININELDWALHTKFSVALGLKNYVDPTRPDIIWFSQGIFIIHNFSHNLNQQGLQIQITGKDKMCLLDGTVGGALFATYNFSKLDLIDSEGKITQKVDTPIYQIVRNAVRTYAQEPWSNIVINDLGAAVELIQYKLEDRALYIYRNSATEDFQTYGDGMIFGNTKEAIFYGFEEIDEVTNKSKILVQDGDIYYCPKAAQWISITKVVTYGETAGYRETTLTYAGDLILNAGQAVTNMLDKIVQQLGDFEYFYDVDGKFIFQKKKTYFNTSWNNAVTNDRGDTYYESNAALSQYSYEFARGTIVESFSNKPNLLNIRNDWALWGTMTGASGVDIPIHMRYAIDDKPESYTSLRTGKFYSTNPILVAQHPDSLLVDWREVIFQMAWDNAKYQSHVEELTYAFYNNYYHYDLNKIDNNDYKYYYRYDFDKKSMIRIGTYDELIDEIKKENFIFGPEKNLSVGEYRLDNKGQRIPEDISMYDETTDEGKANIEFHKKHYVVIPYPVEKEIIDWNSTWGTKYDAYYTDMLTFWRDIYNPDRNHKFFTKVNQYNEELISFDQETWDAWRNNHYWNPTIMECTNEPSMIKFIDPGMLKFWLEFIDTNSDLGQYRVSLIGRRSKAINDDKIKAIFYRETPGVLFIDPTSNQPKEGQLNYVRMNLVGGLSNYFIMSTQGKSAKEEMDTLIYETTYYQESITLNCLPIYYLSPNTKIKVEDELTGIRGEYLVKSFNYSLTHDGMMSITATRAMDRII